MKNIALTILVLGIGCHSFAMTVCETYIPDHSICGSGKVQLIVNGREFTINVGDVGCWFGDVQASGSIDSRNASRYTLISLKRTNGGEFFSKAIGDFQFQAKTAALRLYSKEGGIRSDSYALECKDL